MKKTIFILALTIPLAAGIIFTGYQSSAGRLIAAKNKILPSDRDLSSKQKVANLSAVNPINPEEWIKFKNDSEVKIRNHEIRIAELNGVIINHGEKYEALYKRKVAYLDQQNKFMKARLESYEKGPSNWESFKQGFNYDLDAIAKALKDFPGENSK